LFFKIGEVAKIVGVRPHVLRYWESEFTQLRPMKTRGSHRVYRRRDVELAVTVRSLLQDQGFTIAGAKKRLRELSRQAVPPAQRDPAAAREVRMRAELLAIRRDLGDLLRRLDQLQAEPAEPKQQVRATVTAAVSSSVPLRKRQ
jgi:DNA-binding transcriptional MerR regulator